MAQMVAASRQNEKSPARDAPGFPEYPGRRSYSTLNASGLAWRIAGWAVSFASTSAGTGPST